ncbi:hypothetical protein HDU82_007414 [Entophlyctis luteolus]|nr:hypothetical protein HDU82_007414 [Entophlyctis luteolus]
MSITLPVALLPSPSSIEACSARNRPSSSSSKPVTPSAAVKAARAKRRLLLANPTFTSNYPLTAKQKLLSCGSHVELSERPKSCSAVDVARNVGAIAAEVQENKERIASARIRRRSKPAQFSDTDSEESYDAEFVSFSLSHKEPRPKDVPDFDLAFKGSGTISAWTEREDETLIDGIFGAAFGEYLAAAETPSANLDDVSDEDGKKADEKILDDRVLRAKSPTKILPARQMIEDRDYAQTDGKQKGVDEEERSTSSSSAQKPKTKAIIDSEERKFANRDSSERLQITERKIQRVHNRNFDFHEFEKSARPKTAPDVYREYSPTSFANMCLGTAPSIPTCKNSNDFLFGRNTSYDYMKHMLDKRGIVGRKYVAVEDASFLLSRVQASPKAPTSQNSNLKKVQPHTELLETRKNPAAESPAELALPLIPKEILRGFDANRLIPNDIDSQQDYLLRSRFSSRFATVRPKRTLFDR